MLKKVELGILEWHALCVNYRWVVIYVNNCGIGSLLRIFFSEMFVSLEIVFF